MRTSRTITTLWILSGLAVVLATSVAVAQDSLFSLQEAQTRQLAIRILRALQPIEGWTVKTETAPKVATPARRSVEVTGARVNLRAGPSTDSEILAAGRQGDIYEYVGTQGEWYLVRLDDARQAYISARFARLSAEDTPEPTAAGPKERLDPKFLIRTRQILGENKQAVDALTKIAADAQSDFDREYKGKTAAEDDAEFWTATASMVKIRKYAGGSAGQFQRFLDLAGGEMELPRATAAWSRKVTGTVSAGFGSNTAESRQSGLKVSDAEVTRSEIAADVFADLSPNDRVGISIGRSEEIHFAEITRMHAALNYDRRLGDKARLSSRAGLRRYTDAQNDLADQNQTEFSVQGNAKVSKSVDANASVGITGASHPNNADMDYKDTLLGLGVGGRAGDGARWNLRYARTAHDADLSTDASDNTQSRVEGVLSLNKGARSSFDIKIHSESYDFDLSSDPRTYSRRGVRLALRNRGEPGNSSTASVEFRQKEFDVLEDRNYSEVRAELNSDKLTDDGQRSSSRFWSNYRHFSGNGTQGFLDYVETRSDISSEPGNRFFSETSLYGQYFFENNNVKRDALVTQFAWLGLVIGPDGAVKIGPHVATNTTLAIADRPPGQDTGTFEHPNNTVRYGAKVAVNIRRNPIRLRGSGRYELTTFYNQDDAPTPSRFELEGEGAYQINEQVDASLKLKFYSTGSDDPGAVESSELDVLFGFIYRIGGRQ